MSTEQLVKSPEDPILHLNINGIEEGFENTETVPKKPSNPDQYNTIIPHNDITGQFLIEATSHRLLSKKEEQHLTNQLEKGRSFEDNERTLESMRLTDSAREAFNILVNHNLRLVVSIARKYQGQGVELDDLIGIGNEGLMKGIAKFEPDRGLKLSTYVTWWIRQSVSRYIACNSRVIRLPVHYHDQLNRMSIAIEGLTQELNRKPTRKEIADSICVTPSEIDRMLSDLRNPISLEEPYGDGYISDENELGDTIKDPQANTSEEGDSKIINDLVKKAWLDIPDMRDKLVIGLRNGLMDGNLYTLEEIAQLLGLTQERIRQIEVKAVRHLRNELKKHRADLNIFDK